MVETQYSNETTSNVDSSEKKSGRVHVNMDRYMYNFFQFNLLVYLVLLNDV